MFIRKFAFFPPSLRSTGCHEIFILFFADDPARGFIHFESKRRATEGEKNREREREREKTRGRQGSSKNHDAIIFVPARERILRPSGSGRWTEEKKKKPRGRLKARKKD